MSQSQGPNPKGAGTASWRRGTTLKEREIQRAKGASSPSPRPFSPEGRHAGLRVKLLEVGNVLGRDEPASLSRVSLGELSKALSDFLGASILDEREPPFESPEGGTRPPSRAVSATSGGGKTPSKDEKDKMRAKALRKDTDARIIARLKENLNHGL